MEKQFIAGGFRFATQKESDEAQKEYEAVQYIRANTDLNNPTAIVKLYNKLIEKKSLTTVVGVTFLWELRQKIITVGAVSEANLRPIEALRGKAIVAASVDMMKASNDRKNIEKADNLRVALRNTRIVCVFLAFIIAGMFYIVMKIGKPAYDAEARLQDKYSAWEQTLAEKEAELIQREEKLKENK